MKGEPKVIEYLNGRCGTRLTAINQYWLHYRLLDNWGLKSLAKQWRKESIEEMEHADKLVDRIIFLDGFPNMQVLDPLHIGQNVKEILDCDLKAEIFGAHALRRGGDALPCASRLRDARSVREADEGRGAATSTSSRSSSISSPSSASSSTRSTTSARSTTRIDRRRQVLSLGLRDFAAWANGAARNVNV